MATTEIVSQTFRNCIVIFSIITIHSSFVTASVISFQQPASSPGNLNETNCMLPMLYCDEIGLFYRENLICE